LENLLPHLILLDRRRHRRLPVYLAIIASTTTTPSSQRPDAALSGSHGLETYWNTIVSGTGKTTRAPVGGMMLNSLIMAIGIAVGKIAISTSRPTRSCSSHSVPDDGVLDHLHHADAAGRGTHLSDLQDHQRPAHAGFLRRADPALDASATATLLFRQFFMTVPKELVEASKIDGAGPIRFFWDTVAAAFGDQHRSTVRHPLHLRLEPVSLAPFDHDRDDMQTIVIGIKKIIDVHDALTEWQVAMATAVLAMLPPSRSSC